MRLKSAACPQSARGQASPSIHLHSLFCSTRFAPIALARRSRRPSGSAPRSAACFARCSPPQSTPDTPQPLPSPRPPQPTPRSPPACPFHPLTPALAWFAPAALAQRSLAVKRLSPTQRRLLRSLFNGTNAGSLGPPPTAAGGDGDDDGGGPPIHYPLTRGLPSPTPPHPARPRPLPSDPGPARKA